MISKDNAEHYYWGDNCDGWRLVNRQDMSIIHEKMPPGTQEIRHYHAIARQFFFVLCGQLTIEVAGEISVLAPHSGREIPPGAGHQVSNSSDRDVEFIVISHPSTQGDRQETTGDKTA